MKLFIAALSFLILLPVFLYGATCVCNRFTETLCEYAEAIPTDTATDFVEKEQAVERLSLDFESHAVALSFFANEEDLAGIREKLAVAKANAASKDAAGFTSSVFVLRQSLNDLREELDFSITQLI